MPRLKPQAKLFLIIVVGAGVVFGLRSAMQHGLIPTPGIMKAMVASRVELPTATGGAGSQRAGAALSHERPGQCVGDAYPVRYLGVERDVRAHLRQRRPGHDQGIADGEEWREPDACIAKTRTRR